MIGSSTIVKNANPSNRLAPRYYTDVQFIGFEVYTAPGINLDGTQFYPGKIPNSLTDIQQRVLVVKQAVETANNWISKSNKQEILKVFMLPEFYFRGVQGVYDESPYLSNLVTELGKISGDSKFVDWLFVFGTAVVRNQNNPLLLANVSIIQKGGEPLTATHLIRKENKSNVDFIYRSNLSPLSPINTLVDQNIDLQFSGNKELGFYWPTICCSQTRNPINFGLEICLDHANKKLKNFLRGGEVDIQLISSCGMQIQLDSIAVKKRGYIFLCDGNDCGIEVFHKRENDNYVSIFNSKQRDIVDHTNPRVSKRLPASNNNPIQIPLAGLYARPDGWLTILPPLALNFSHNKISWTFGLAVSQSLFPLTTSDLTVAMSDEPILLNGMKVLFDNPTPTTPVTLQPKQRGTNNGR